MNTIECIKFRRSVRAFSNDPISHEILEQIVDAASFSPSWKNTQITRYIAVETPALKSQVAALTPAYNAAIINSAPMLIAITILKNRSGFERDGSYTTIKREGWQMFDAGIATQTFCLAARELGISSVVLGILDYEKIAELLHVPSDQELVALVPIGYEIEHPVTPKRKALEDLLRYQ